MTSGGQAAATALARPVDLSTAWNATNDEAAARLHPLYRPALERLPDGEVVLRGLPFRLGLPAAGKRWILVERDLTLDLGDRGRAPADPIGSRGPADARSLGRASHLVVAHFCDSWRDPAGERPAGLPVGWVMPAGEPLARYELGYPDGRTQALEIRRRFEIDDGIIGWGFLPYAALSHHADEPLDWRGPFPRQEPGRYAPAGHAGPLTMLPGTWAAAQTGAADFVPTAEDDATLWLHAIPIEGDVPPSELRLSPLAEGRSGTAVIVAGVTFFHGRADPLVARPRRQLYVTGALGELPGVDLGLAIRSLPAIPLDASAADSRPIGWGRPVADGGARPRSSMSARPPDARIRLGAAGRRPGRPRAVRAWTGRINSRSGRRRGLDPGAAPAEHPDRRPDRLRRARRRPLASGSSPATAATSRRSAIATRSTQGSSKTPEPG